MLILSNDCLPLLFTSLFSFYVFWMIRSRCCCRAGCDGVGICCEERMVVGLGDVWNMGGGCQAGGWTGDGVLGRRLCRRTVGHMHCVGYAVDHSRWRKQIKGWL